MTVPGSRLRRFAERVCDSRALERLIDPLIADMQAEYHNARLTGRLWASRWVRLQGYLAFVKVVAWHRGEDLVASFHAATVEDRQAVRRTAVYSAAVLALATVLLLLPPFVGRRIDMSLTRVLFLVPQALPLAIPIGIAVGIVCGLSGRALSRRARNVAVLMALTGCIVSFFVIARMAPSANQAFRVSVMGERARTRGANELTLGELRQLIGRGSRERGVLVLPTDPRDLAFGYYFRWAITGATPVLAAFALTVVRLRPGLPRAMILVGFALFGYYELMQFARMAALNMALWPVAGAWLPNAVFLTVTAVLALLNRRVTRGAGGRPD
jgi:hypothetical protein